MSEPAAMNRCARVHDFCLPVSMRWIFLLVTACALWAGAAAAAAPQLAPLVDRLAADGFDRAEIVALFNRPDLVYDPVFMGKKIRVLFRTRYGLAPPPQPANPDRPKTKFYEPHLTPEMLVKVRVFMEEHAATLRTVESAYGLPPTVAMAFLVVETKLGEFLGSQNAFMVLAGMAVSTEYQQIAPFLEEYLPTEEQLQWVATRQADKAGWAYAELKALLRYARTNRLDPTQMPGSIYGAIGMCQFLPSNALRFGQDGDADGMVNLFAADDALMSLGHFLYKAGWKPTLTREAKIKVIQRYNPDIFYAKTIMSVAEHL